tara:strand:- start:1 stop:594 length:594 start_codon:yes stop_codon:yes gene_type:complete
MKKKYDSDRIGNFLLGQTIQCATINAFERGLNYASISSGFENKFSPIKKAIWSLSFKSEDEETLINAESIRKDPDVILLSPKGKILQLEIKSRSIKCFDNFMGNNFNNHEIRHVMEFYRNVRFVYVDLSKRKIASIYTGKKLTQEAQYNNWYHPESWIDGINNRAELLAWQEEYIFAPLIIQSEKTISRLGNEIYET